jgi:DNA-binding MarR family transcriptional regulator
MPARPDSTFTQLELADAIRLVAGKLSRRLRQQALGDLTLSQRSVLVTLESSGPLRMGELAGIENVRPPSITGIVGRLEARHLVTRIPDPDDARSTVVQITAEAVAILNVTRRERSAFLADRISRLTDSEIDTLAAGVRLLDRMIDR